jgi:hypothetical protein
MRLRTDRAAPAFLQLAKVFPISVKTVAQCFALPKGQLGASGFANKFSRVPHQRRARPEDRREGTASGSRTSSRRAHSRALHSAATDPRLARSHAHRKRPHLGSGQGHKPRAQAACRRRTSSSLTLSQTCLASRAVPCWMRLLPEKPVRNIWRSAASRRR